MENSNGNGRHASGNGRSNGFHARSTAGKVITCKAAVVWAPGEPFVVQDVQVDPPKSMEVRLRILFTSICHSDLSAWLGLNEAQRAYPRILGHEASGVVESVGDGVGDVEEGDHVVPIFNGECKKCVYCRSNKTNLCGEFRVNPLRSTMKGDGGTRFSVTDGDGQRRPIYHFLNTSTFAEYTVLDSACVVKIDARAPLHKMCLLSCGISTENGNAEEGVAGIILNVAKESTARILALEWKVVRFQQALFAAKKEEALVTMLCLKMITDAMGKSEQMIEYIKKLKACIKWFMELEDGYQTEQERLQNLSKSIF